MAVEISPLNDFVHLSNSIGNEAGRCLNEYPTIIDLQLSLETAQINFTTTITDFDEIKKIDEAINQHIKSLNRIVLKIQNKSANLINYDFNSSLFNDTQELLKSLFHSFQTLDKLVMGLHHKTIHSIQTYNEVTVSSRVSKEGEDKVKFEMQKLTRELIIQRNSILSYTENLIELAENTLISISDASNIVNENLIKENILKLNFTEHLNEEKSLLIKQFNNELSIIKERYETAFKSYESDRERVQQSANLLATAVDAGLKNANELNEKTQNLDVFFSTIINEKKSIIDQELENERKKISTNIKDAKDALFAEEKIIRDAHQGFITIVQNAGIHKLTENYERKSGKEETEYKNYRKYTSWSILAAIGSTFLILIGAWIQQIVTDQDTNYLFLASRLTLSLMFFVLAFYLSKQAAKHYECFQENHRTFLQLAALEPFMAKMNDDEKKAIRKELISTYFNQNADGKFASKGDEVSWLDVKSYLEKIPEFGKSNPATNNNEPPKTTNG
ncbi:hypothetical protein [Acinetobacter baumannii]|uniref:hypothetical protein n=1 Tax=Acinetobacter baumannii TaxID=470 RepID=UPI003F5E6665